MARRSTGVAMPSGQGGLIGGYSSNTRTKFEFSPKLVIYFALACVIFIWVLFSIN